MCAGQRWETRGRLWAALVFLIAVLEIFVLDSFVPLGATPAILYLLVVLLVARDERRSRTYAVAWLVTLLCVVGYFLKTPSIGEEWKALLNRALIVVSAWFIVLAMPPRARAASTIHVELTPEEREALADTPESR